MAETIPFYDGGGAQRTATLDDDGTFAFSSQGRQVRVAVAPTNDPGGGLVTRVSTDIAVLAYALLALFKQRNSTYGDRLAFDLDGPKVALYQEHPPDKGKNYPHPGVTLLQATGLKAPEVSPAPPANATTTSGGTLTTAALAVGGLALIALGIKYTSRSSQVHAMNAVKNMGLLDKLRPDIAVQLMLESDMSPVTYWHDGLPVKRGDRFTMDPVYHDPHTYEVDRIIPRTIRLQATDGSGHINANASDFQRREGSQSGTWTRVRS